MNILQLKQSKNKNKKVLMITCYDYTAAKIIEETDIDGVLVGDSVAMVMHGYNSTINATLEMMVMHTEAVARGMTTKFIVADLPFLSYRQSLKNTMKAVKKLMQAGAHAVKLEGATGNTETISYIVDSGVPVMGHIGLTPQFIHELGGFKLQGKTEEKANILIEQAKMLEKAGCCAIVLECIPALLAQTITNSVNIPTIGVGAGPYTSGQIIVQQDILGLLNNHHHPKFLKTYLNGFSLHKEAINNFVKEVHSDLYPAIEEHCY